MKERALTKRAERLTAGVLALAAVLLAGPTGHGSAAPAPRASPTRRPARHLDEQENVAWKTTLPGFGSSNKAEKRCSPAGALDRRRLPSRNCIIVVTAASRNPRGMHRPVHRRLGNPQLLHCGRRGGQPCQEWLIAPGHFAGPERHLQ